MDKDYELFLKKKKFTTHDFLKNLDTYSTTFNWENEKLDYLLKEPIFGWENESEKYGVNIPEKPDDIELLPFIEFTLEDFRKKGEQSEDIIKTLELLKLALEDFSKLSSEIDLVKFLYDLDDLHRVIDRQYSYINEKNRAIGFTKKVMLFTIDRVREIINSKSLE